MSSRRSSAEEAGQLHQADEPAVASALAEAAALGGYFEISHGAEPPGAWQPADAVYQRGMRELAAQTGHRLGVHEERVAISTFQLGYAARLWSPVLACALADGIVPDLARLQVCAELPLRLWLPAPAGWYSPDDGQLAHALYRVTVTEHLAPLAAGLRGRIAEGLLWGNAASAMIGSLTVLARARPVLAQPARCIAGRLLATGLLRGTGSLTGPGLEFRRSSCCLYYRVPGGGLCGDCSLRQGKD
jgi:ferric iron reductase protein FhuF